MSKNTDKLKSRIMALSKGKAASPEVIEAEVVSTTETAVDFYHAQHPEVRELRETQIRDIGQRIGDLSDMIKPFVQQFFEAKAQPIWEVGVKVVAFIDGTPCKGGELSEDLFRQFVFLDSHGRPITRAMLNWFARIGRKYPTGVDKTFAVTELWRELPDKFGEQKTLALNAEETKPKVKAIDNPYDFFRVLHVRAQEDSGELVRQLEAFKANPQFGDFATLRERRAELHYEMHKKMSEALAARLADAEAMRGVLQVMGAPTN